MHSKSVGRGLILRWVSDDNYSTTASPRPVDIPAPRSGWILRYAFFPSEAEREIKKLFTIGLSVEQRTRNEKSRRGLNLYGLPLLLIIALIIVLIIIIAGGSPLALAQPDDPPDEISIESLSMDPLGAFQAHLHAARMEPGKDGIPLEAEEVSIDINGRLSGSVFDGRIILKSRRLVLDGSEFKQARIDFDGKLNLAVGLDLIGDFTLSFSKPPSQRVKDRVRKDNVKNNVKKISFRQVTSKLQWDDRSGDGKLTFGIGSVDANHIETMVSSMRPIWPKALSLVSGQVSLDGALQWNAGKGEHPVIVTVGLSDVGGSYDKMLFSGLKGRFETIVGDGIQSKASEVSCAIVDVGVPITDLRGALGVKIGKDKRPVIVVDNLQARIFGGHVSEPRIRLDLNRKTNDFNLRFQDIDVARLIALYPLEGLQADGKLNGNLPLTLGPEGIGIHDGKIKSLEPGGRIQYQPNDGERTLAGAAGQMALLFHVLEDFHYHALDATANYTPDGQLGVHIALKGKGAKIDKGRSVHFNLNIEQNIMSLLKSLRLINGLNKRLDEKVRRRYSSSSGGQ